jgi:hypothetical protein
LSRKSMGAIRRCSPRRVRQDRRWTCLTCKAWICRLRRTGCLLPTIVRARDGSRRRRPSICGRPALQQKKRKRRSRRKRLTPASQNSSCATIQSEEEQDPATRNRQPEPRQGRPSLAQRRGPQHARFWRDGVERFSAGKNGRNDSSPVGTNQVLFSEGD